MRVQVPGEPHLTYCSNIHPGESWPRVRENLGRYVPEIRNRVAPGRPFGLGLRLSAAAAAGLAHPDELARLREFLNAHDLYIFTINGFPYGPFHGRAVKERVYLPDWLDEARVKYTNCLAELLAALLPEGVEGTISTVPGGYGPRIRGSENADRVAAAMARHAARLYQLRAETGARIALAIEPEPCCFLETVEQTIEFFRRRILGPAGVRAFARMADLSTTKSEAALRQHVGVCLDACHMAVQFEDPAKAVAALEREGIRIAKVQVSAGLRARVGTDPDALHALRAFADDVYLHQVVEGGADGRLTRYLDLPDALQAMQGAPTHEREWRIHFHVPLFRERLGALESTQAYVRELLALVLAPPLCQHFEVETYTWDVLPEEFRGEEVAVAVARELEWTAEQMTGAAARAGA